MPSWHLTAAGSRRAAPGTPAWQCRCCRSCLASREMPEHLGRPHDFRDGAELSGGHWHPVSAPVGDYGAMPIPAVAGMRGCVPCDGWWPWYPPSFLGRRWHRQPSMEPYCTPGQVCQVLWGAVHHSRGHLAGGGWCPFIKGTVSAAGRHLPGEAGPWEPSWGRDCDQTGCCAPGEEAAPSQLPGVCGGALAQEQLVLVGCCRPTLVTESMFCCWSTAWVPQCQAGAVPGSPAA